MLSQGQQAAINRETALELLEDLGRLQERDKQAQELARRLRELLADFEASSGDP